MNILKLCKTFAVTTMLLLAQMNAPAMANVDFNSNQTVGPLFGGATVLSGDYSFSATQAFGIVSDIPTPFGVSNGTNMMVFSNQGLLTITRTDTGLFSMSSLDVGGWSGVVFPTAQLRIVGHSQNGDQEAFSPILSTTSFAHFALSPLFTNLSSLSITMVGYQSSAYAAIDNLALAPVPEPETYAMMLAGLGLLGFLGRRRKQ